MLIMAMAAVLVAAPVTIDKSKFEATYRSGKAIEGALTVGVNRFKYQELIQGLSTEIAIARDEASTDAETLLLALYTDSLRELAVAAAMWDSDYDRGEGFRRGSLRLKIAAKLYSAGGGSEAIDAAKGALQALRDDESAPGREAEQWAIQQGAGPLATACAKLNDGTASAEDRAGAAREIQRLLRTLEFPADVAVQGYRALVAAATALDATVAGAAANALGLLTHSEPRRKAVLASCASGSSDQACIAAFRP